MPAHRRPARRGGQCQPLAVERQSGAAIRVDTADTGSGARQASRFPAQVVPTAAGAGRFAALRGGAGQAASRDAHPRLDHRAALCQQDRLAPVRPRSTAAFGAGPLYGRTQARPVDRQGVLRYRFAYAASAGGVRRRSASEIRNDRKPLRKGRIRGLVQRRQVAHPHPPAAHSCRPSTASIRPKSSCARYKRSVGDTRKGSRRPTERSGRNRPPYPETYNFGLFR